MFHCNVTDAALLRFALFDGLYNVGYGAVVNVRTGEYADVSFRMLLTALTRQ